MLRSEVTVERSAGLHALLWVGFPERDELLRSCYLAETVGPLYETAAVTLIREGDRFDRIARFREQRAEVQKKLVETCLQAARDGGMPEAELKAVLARLEESEKNRAHSGRGADWLSGATLFEGKNPSEDRAPSGGG